MVNYSPHPRIFRREGCSHEAMEKAAKNGHLRVAHLLLDLGKPCTAAAIRLAKVHGHLEVFELLSRAYPERVSEGLIQEECGGGDIIRMTPLRN